MSRDVQMPSKALSVEGIAYGHGLFCASHPRIVIAMVGVVIMICRYQLYSSTIIL